MPYTLVDYLVNVLAQMPLRHHGESRCSLRGYSMNQLPPRLKGEAELDRFEFCLEAKRCVGNLLILPRLRLMEFQLHFRY
ncbi:hypothetical protein WJ21_18570 [Burkholderia vietnamiensis]|nr:hypothetical protein WJ21_18570 [Burkholderia vietnamiensis]